MTNDTLDLAFCRAPFLSTFLGNNEFVNLRNLDWASGLVCGLGYCYGWAVLWVVSTTVKVISRYHKRYPKRSSESWEGMKTAQDKNMMM
mmetsp:Transcript_9539/g.17160  ORF Transcript_9539/g.17160 Transcript_9539/m.17160 type:complete len:89 (-) Transcript_9539:327-593(-)